MEQHVYITTFDQISPAEANHYAGELRNALLNAAPDIEVARKREDPRTQDLGTILIAVLGTSSVTAFVKALGDWLKLRHSVGVTIKTQKGEITGTNLTGKDALKLAELFHPDGFDE